MGDVSDDKKQQLADADDDDAATADADKSVFVTVGTTEFDALIRRLCSSPILARLRARGFRRLVLQIGRGAFEPTTSLMTDDNGVGGVGGSGNGVLDDVAISWYRLKPSISEVRMIHITYVTSGKGIGVFEYPPI